MDSELLSSSSSSPVWAFFGFENDGNGKPKDRDSPKCCLCLKRVSVKGSNTSNLLAHLRIHHPSKFGEVDKQRKLQQSPSFSKSTQPCIIDKFEKAKQYERNWKKWKELTDSMTFCLVRDMLPLYMVEKEGFKKMVHAMDPRYDLPSRKYFSNAAIPALYQSTCKRVQKELDMVQFFAATTA